jgi:hypothetical protein
MNEITEEQLEELEETISVDRIDFNYLLEEYTGIVAKPYTAFVYYDSTDNWVGDSDNYTVRDILENAYITVKENDDAK